MRKTRTGNNVTESDSNNIIKCVKFKEIGSHKILMTFLNEYNRFLPTDLKHNFSMNYVFQKWFQVPFQYQNSAQAIGGPPL